MRNSNPLHDIAANFGITPKVFTQLATGDDLEFRELVRGILSILPEHELIQVASDSAINPEFLDYLCHLFDTNDEVLLTLLQNPSSSKTTKHYILEHLAEGTLTTLLQQADTIPEVLQIVNQLSKADGAKMNTSAQSAEFRIKMKVSKLLNDIEANLGVTIEAFLHIRSKDDEQSREFVREVYDALPEDNVLLVGRDVNASPKILDYLARLFDTNFKVLLTILHNPSADDPTRQFILQHLPENVAVLLAESPNTPPKILQLLSEHFRNSKDVLMVLLANALTPPGVKKVIQAQCEEVPVFTVMPEAVGIDSVLDTSDETILELGTLDQVQVEQTTDFDDIEAKVSLCADKLYEINAEIVAEFIAQAHSEIATRLEQIAKANRLILKTVVRVPNLSIEDLEAINMGSFVSLLHDLPSEPDVESIVQLIQQSKECSRSTLL
ncbi:hypothetical protein CSB45_03270 [candidate division KSB3 bacterium]|uniref:Uncharacterized protein n=1 Tax=candidate division KSB3 bacterium TaxID=2044937 RepID=A0A2G6E9X9_9BACT|nr:MAG: hypothetical protein CSB45_03270 [candidate division KSB3 bacterium]PIE29516.1 MAG: hypothetical protein CSA57_07865 [candidate division KSB3 bacterium]